MRLSDVVLDSGKLSEEVFGQNSQLDFDGWTLHIKTLSINDTKVSISGCQNSVVSI